MNDKFRDMLLAVMITFTLLIYVLEDKKANECVCPCCVCSEVENDA